MRVTFCGTGVGRFEGVRAGSGIYVHGAEDGEGILLDCGPGVPLRAMDAGIDLRSVRAVVLSHLHFDHAQGIGDLLTQLTAIDAPLPTIYGPPGTRDYARAATAWARRQFENRPFKMEGAAEAREIEAGDVLRVAGLEVVGTRVPHAPELVCHAYRVTDGERTFVFSGDTRSAPEVMAPFARGADLLAHECYSDEAVAAFAARTTPERAERVRARFPETHTRVQDAAAIASAAGVKTLALTHLMATEEPGRLEEQARRAFGGKVLVAADGLAVEV